MHLIADLKGDPGAAGVSPTVTVSKTGTVTTITITDATRTKTATINDGTDGKDGADYVLTDADKQEIAALVKSLCTTETWAFELEDGTTVTKDVLLV